MTEKEIFEFTYCAPQQNEIRQIREKYLPGQLSKLDQLRAMDARASKRGLAVALVHGILSALVLGVGMCCCMVWSAQAFLPGIFIGCTGLAGAAVTYPIYNRIVTRDREKIAPEILRLSEELLLENQ